MKVQILDKQKTVNWLADHSWELAVSSIVLSVGLFLFGRRNKSIVIINNVK